MICQAHLVKVQKVFDEIRGAGGEVLTITPSQPAVLAAHRRVQSFPFPVVGDPEYQAYRAFGLDRGSLMSFFHPRALFRYLGLMIGGWWPRRPQKGEDVFQLGGDFVLDRVLRLRFIYRSAEPSDRPSMSRLLSEVERACAASRARAPYNKETSPAP